MTKSTTSHRFRVSYRIDRWPCAAVVDAVDASTAEAHVRKRLGATSITNITVQCDGVKANGERCTRFSQDDQCPAHRPRE